MKALLTTLCCLVSINTFANSNLSQRPQPVIANCNLGDGKNLVIYQKENEFNDQPAVIFQKGHVVGHAEAEASHLGRDWAMVSSWQDDIVVTDNKTKAKSFLIFQRAPQPASGAGDGFDNATSEILEELPKTPEAKFLKLYGHYDEPMLYVSGNSATYVLCHVPQYGLEESIVMNLEEIKNRRGAESTMNSDEYRQTMKTFADSLKNEKARSAVHSFLDDQLN